MSLENAIQNIGEYYAAHYLAEQFARDIADQIKAWKDQGSQSVPRRLQALSDLYFRAKTLALEYPNPGNRAGVEDRDLRGWHARLLEALGYTPEPLLLELESDQQVLPAMLRLNRHGRPWLAVLEAPFCLSDGSRDEEPLELSVPPLPPTWEPHRGGWPSIEVVWEQAIATLFKQEERPRWALLLAGSRVYLFDAHTFAQGRYLSIHLDDAFARKSAKTFESIAALLSRDTLAPGAESDEVLHERLRAGSLRSTHGVSEQLQSAVREAITAIANGWVAARREHKLGFRLLGEREDPLPDGSREVTAEQLRHEALVYVYRILFCLYAEARGRELGILPISDDVYRLGYSLEALRDLADRGEPGVTTENGAYYAQHLERLFGLIHAGFHPEAQARTSPASAAEAEDIESDWRKPAPYQLDLFGDEPPRQLSLGMQNQSGRSRKVIEHGSTKAFVIQPLTATLFNPEATPLLQRVQLANRVLHQVIRCLSLGTGQTGNRAGRQIGRINYAELGIVQLGSVYEGLLAYQGFFATEDLIQVLQAPKKASGQAAACYDDDIDPKTPTWFVPKTRLEDFKPGEVVMERRTRQPRVYKTGEFILHLNGIDRINSASYYTPAVLTETLVRETLKERLKDLGPDRADDILALTICEPAMGSAAFLVEALGQLADRYLSLKQAQVGRSIEPGEYEDQRRRVMHFIAVHNLYGVDLNPTAVELGALSLWLASIHRLKVRTGENGAPDVYRTCATPWFGLRLRPGNSLIGARRAVWTEAQLAKGLCFGKNAEVPRQLKPGEVRQADEIYHFLVWDEDMAPVARDKRMRAFWPDECALVGQWQREQVKQAWTQESLATARRICERIDQLWDDYGFERSAALLKTRCAASVWPDPIPRVAEGDAAISLAEQEAIKRRLEAESGAFQRLRLLMDAWCSLYFWPLDASRTLPSRAAWLAAAEVLLGVGVEDPAMRQLLAVRLGDEIDLEKLFTAVQGQLPDAGALSRAVPWYGVARELAARQPFHHWELVFTEVLGPAPKASAERAGQAEPPRGFDLMFGNPPWIKVSWNDAPLLAEFEPLLGVRDAQSATYNRERLGLLEAQHRRFAYRDAFEQGEGAGVFLNDSTLYPSLAGVQTNLYKNFIERSWALLGATGVSGLIHEEGVFEDAKGGLFRERYYGRLLARFQFKNERVLFADVDHHKAFSINVYRGAMGELGFTTMFNVFDPGTIGQSQRHANPHDPIPGIKNAGGGWETRGHSERILTITEHELALFARLFEDADTPPLQARLPQVHSRPLLKVLEKFAAAPRRLGDLKGEYLATVMFDETYAQRDGIITREADPTFQPRKADDWVVSGPHFFVGTPFNRTPRARSLGVKGSDYDDIDLTEIPDDYLPRALYRPGDRDGDLTSFYSAIPEWPKPRKPENGRGGFWPVSESDLPDWELLLGEPLKLYGVDPTSPGGKTARRFGYFVEWEGDIAAAMDWLLLVWRWYLASLYGFGAVIHAPQSLPNQFNEIRLKQGDPNHAEMKLMPRPLTAFYRIVVRDMCASGNERSLIGSLLSGGPTAIHAVRFVSVTDDQLLVLLEAVISSVPADYFIKVKGRGHVHNSDLGRLPLPINYRLNRLLIDRAIRLSCITTQYADLWKSTFDPNICTDAFTWGSTHHPDSAAHPTHRTLRWNELTPNWQRGCALRTDRERRQAMLEIDVLVAMALNLTFDELKQIYEVQFPVMRAYEQADRYDATGRRLPNTTRKDAGAKELREALAHHDGQSPITLSWDIDNGNQTVTKTFLPPFTPVDRIADYERAFRIFRERLSP